MVIIKPMDGLGWLWLGVPRGWGDKESLSVVILQFKAKCGVTSVTMVDSKFCPSIRQKKNGKNLLVSASLSLLL